MKWITIRELGLQRWLDSEIQRQMHNGYGYEAYMEMMDQPGGHDKVSLTFGVAVRTVFYWEKQEKLRLAEEVPDVS